jgi:23S rRNA-intervening sequence protein
MVVRDFRDLLAWRLSYELKCEVFAFTATGPAAKDFKYRDQIRASSASAPANIAEGFGRIRPLDSARFHEFGPRVADGNPEPSGRWPRPGLSRDGSVLAAVESDPRRAQDYNCVVRLETATGCIRSLAAARRPPPLNAARALSYSTPVLSLIALCPLRNRTRALCMIALFLCTIPAPGKPSWTR